MLQGNLRDFSASEILQLLGTQRKTGCLMLEHGDVRMMVHVLDGRVVSTRTPGAPKDDPLLAFLRLAHRLSEEQMRGILTIQQESDRLAPVEVGHAAVTSAGTLRCRFVIHAVGPQWGEGAEERKLRSAVRSSLDHAARLELSSLAVPAISTGIFGYPKEEGTRVIVEEASSWLAAHPGHGLQRLRFTAFDAPTANLFARAVSVGQ